jgi:hypothetical protein
MSAPPNKALQLTTERHGCDLSLSPAWPHGFEHERIPHALHGLDPSIPLSLPHVRGIGFTSRL